MQSWHRSNLRGAQARRCSAARVSAPTMELSPSRRRLLLLMHARAQAGSFRVRVPEASCQHAAAAHTQAAPYIPSCTPSPVPRMAPHAPSTPYPRSTQLFALLAMPYHARHAPAGSARDHNHRRRAGFLNAQSTCNACPSSSFPFISAMAACASFCSLYSTRA